MTQPTRGQALAEVGYTAYGEATGWRDIQGDPMSTWSELPQPQASAWVAAAEAIEKKLTTPEIGTV